MATLISVVAQLQSYYVYPTRDHTQNRQYEFDPRCYLWGLSIPIDIRMNSERKMEDAEANVNRKV